MTRGGRGSALGWLLGLAAVIYGAAAAVRSAWLCDDAFISFRYAENLQRGLGLVYNAGERVEGYTNFLWTIGVSLGMRLGVAPERWANLWGIVFYLGTIVLLVLAGRELRGGDARRSAVPIAALIAAIHSDWNIYATSGLETSMFTFLALLAFWLAIRPSFGARGIAGAGLALALASMTRPDGLLFVPIVGLYLMWTRRPSLQSFLVFAGAFAIAWLPYLAWKLSYFGDFFPNTFYAKSAGLAWYRQGLYYVAFYFIRYWALALAVPLAMLAWMLRRGEARAESRETGQAALLAAALALAYTAYVLRVGGDFMFARLLIPVSTFYALLLEWSVARFAGARVVVQWAGAVLAAAAIAFTPRSIPSGSSKSGIVDEREYYPPEAVARARRDGLTLRRYFDGLPVRVAYVGSQASLMYYARPAVAIESQTGLTDRWIARQPLAQRGRVGHEKIAPLSYLIDQRKVHFVIRRHAGETLSLDAAIPFVAIAFDSVPGRIVHWDPELLGEIRRRGARFVDVPTMLDDYAKTLDALSDAEAREAYARVVRFYFAHVHDPAREVPYLARLRRAGG